jgi:hypothetical protein
LLAIGPLQQSCDPSLTVTPAEVGVKENQIPVKQPSSSCFQILAFKKKPNKGQEKQQH